MNEPVLRVENLTLAYPAGHGWLHALEDVSFAIGKGRALGLVGESGSGKSTTALAVLGLLAPEARISSGRILFGAQSLLDLPPEERRALRGDRISVVFQDPFTSLNPAIQVGRQIAEPLVLHRALSDSDAGAEARRLLAEVGIARPEDVARAYPHQLSGGMKQRALIATALACSPELLVLDEPTTALDVTIEAQILDLLEKLRRDRGLSMLYITHNLGVVARICDDVCACCTPAGWSRAEPPRKCCTTPGTRIQRGCWHRCRKSPKGKSASRRSPDAFRTSHRRPQDASSIRAAISRSSVAQPIRRL